MGDEFDGYDEADFGDFDESGDPIAQKDEAAQPKTPISASRPLKTPDSSAGGRRGSRLKSPAASSAGGRGVGDDDQPSQEEAPTPAKNSPAPERTEKAATAKKEGAAPESPEPTGNVDHEQEAAKWKYKAMSLERERDSLQQANKKLQAQAKKGGKKGNPDVAHMKSPTDMGNDDPGHLAQSLAMYEFRTNQQKMEIERLKALIAKGESFQVVDLVNASRDKDRQLLELKKEIKQLERMNKINKAAENLKLQEDIRNLHSQIKAYKFAAIESDRIREKYIKKINKLREEIKMSKMFKYDPAANI